MATAWIALGSNLGDRVANLRAAVERLTTFGALGRVSPVYETEPVGYLDQPPFLNAVVELQTDLAPLDLLHAMQQIETDLGRRRPFPNAPRTLDLDLLFYDNLTLDTAELTLPHPQLHERHFVLTPLADVAPDLVHPRLGQPVSELVAALGPPAGIRPAGAVW